MSSTTLATFDGPTELITCEDGIVWGCTRGGRIKDPKSRSERVICTDHITCIHSNTIDDDSTMAIGTSIGVVVIFYNDIECFREQVSDEGISDIQICRTPLKTTFVMFTTRQKAGRIDYYQKGLSFKIRLPKINEEYTYNKAFVRQVITPLHEYRFVTSIVRSGDVTFTNVLGDSRETIALPVNVTAVGSTSESLFIATNFELLEINITSDRNSVRFLTKINIPTGFSSPPITIIPFTRREEVLILVSTFVDIAAVSLKGAFIWNYEPTSGIIDVLIKTTVGDMEVIAVNEDRELISIKMSDG